MKSHALPSRGVFFATTALALAALTAVPCAAQSACTAGPVPTNGTCTIQGYTAQFSSATGNINPNTTAINLTGGWVLMTPTATVTTSFASVGVSPGPSFLIVAYAQYTALAVLSGTMASPAGLQAGCEVWYASSSGGPSAPVAISSDASVVGILTGLGASYPTTCPQVGG